MLALISFLTVYLLDPLNFGDSDPVAAIPAFLLSIVVLLIGQHFATHQEVERASGFSDRIYEAVKHYLHVTKVGAPEPALEYIEHRLPIVKEVRNTSFNLRDGGDRADEQFYGTETYDRLNKGIAEWTARGGRWKDIGDPRAVARLRRQRRLVDDQRRSLGRYQYRLLTHDEPQLNFIILTYRDGTEEVLFNWDFRSIGRDPTVLASRDRDIVGMFSVQFEHLWRVASPDHDSSATMSTPTK